MPRKVLKLTIMLVFVTYVSPVLGREVWGGLSRLLDSPGEWSDINLCSYTTAYGNEAGNILVSDSTTLNQSVGAGSLCAPCRPGLGSGVLGGGLVGQGGLWSTPPSGEAAEGQAISVGPRALLPGASPWYDPNARGGTWLWIAPTHTSATMGGVEESYFGVAEGIITSYRLTPGLGLYASVAFMHNEDATAFLSTLGVQKFGNPAGPSLTDRATAWIFWDSSVDTLDGDRTHFQQLRFNLGVVGPAGAEVGVAFSISLDEPGEYFLVPVGGVGLLSSGGSVVGPYIRYPIGIFDLTAMLGYSGVSESGVLGLGAEARLTENSSVFLDWKTGGAEAAEGPSSLLVGYKLGFGRADTTRY